MFFPYDEQAIKQLKNADLILKAQKSTSFHNEISKQRELLVSLFQKYEQLGGLLHLSQSEQGGFVVERRMVNTYWNNVNNYLAKLPDLSTIQTKIKQKKEQSDATISFLFAIFGSVVIAVLFGWGSHAILIRNNCPEWWASLSAFVFVVINIIPPKIEGKFVINVAAVVVIIALTLLGSFIGAIGSFLAAHWLCILLTLVALFVLFAMATK